MIRNTVVKLIAVVLLTLSFFVNAEPTDEDKQFCFALSTYAQALVINKIYGDVPKEKAWDYLVERQLVANNLIASSLTKPIKQIIETLYSKDHPPILLGADIAMVVISVNDGCLKERSK